MCVRVLLTRWREGASHEKHPPSSTHSHRQASSEISLLGMILYGPFFILGGGAFFVLGPFELFWVEKCPEGLNSHFKTVLVDIHGHGF